MRANERQRVSAERQGRRRRTSQVLVPFVALILVASACTGPARTTATYESKATETADEVVSASRTVLLAAQLGDDGRSFPPTIAVTIADAETDAETARDAFSSIQPPDAASDQIRGALLPTVQHACDVIADVRIAARRAAVGSLTSIAAPLEQIANQLDGFSAKYG